MLPAVTQGSSFIDDTVPQMPSHVARTSVQPTVQDHANANTSPHIDAQERVQITASTTPLLSQRTRIGTRRQVAR